MEYSNTGDSSLNTGNISTDDFLAIFTSTSTSAPNEAGGGPGGGGGQGRDLALKPWLSKSNSSYTSANSTLNPPLLTVDGQYTVTSLLDNSLTGSTLQSPLDGADINDTIFLLTSNIYNATTNNGATSTINLTSSYGNYNAINQNYTNLNGTNITEVIWDGRYPSGYTLAQIVIASVIVTILMIVIIVGNMLVIIAIATEKSLKNIQNWFIASLAVADFFLGLIIMPFSLANELMGYWIFGSWWCDVHSAMDVLLCTASIMNLCLISLDRYWSITKAVDYLKQRTPARAALMIAAVWIMSALICIPPLLGWKVKMPEGPLPKCAIPCDKKFQLQQHIVTSLHRRSKASNDNNDENAHNSSNTSSNLSDSSNNEFKSDLCEALVAGNIPWNVLSNATFNNFLKKYTGQPIPDESTLRKNYLDKCYQESIKKIRDSIKEESIWISVDETTDKQGRYVANLIVGILSENESSGSFLLSCKQLEQVNNATIARFVNDSIRILWPHGNESKVLLLLTDAAAYMIKTGKNLKVFYPNLIHITCLAHGLNLIAEKVRTSFPVANSFISCVKKFFVKAPLRVQQIVNKELPPEPIITRWGTWLKAASFYADNMDGITELSEDIGYVLYSALGSFYIPSCIMVFVYIRIYFAAKARARRGIKKHPRKTNNEQVTSFTTANKKGTIPMPSSSAGALQKQQQHQIATIETPPNSAGALPMQIPTVTCDLASDISTSEAAEIEPHPLVYPNSSCSNSSNMGLLPANNIEIPSNLSASANCKETLKVSTITTGHGTLNVPVPPSMAANNNSTTTTTAIALNNNNGNVTTTTTTTALTVTTLAPSTGNELKVSPLAGRCRALSVGVDSDMVSEFDPSSSDSGVVSRCAVVKPLKFRLCQPIFGRKSNNRRQDESKALAVKNEPKQEIIKAELEPAIPKVQKPRDPEKEKRRIARKKEKRATLILGLIMGSFIACWLPFFFLYILMPACSTHCHIPDSAFAVAFWLGYMNSALNPAIYTIFNKDFRRAFRRILFK